MSATTLQAVGTTAAERWRRGFVVAFVLAVVAVLLLYRTTFASMVDKWNDDAAFGYGFVIAPLSLWLAWRRREWLRRVPIAPSWVGTFGVVAGAALWIVARGTGVLVVEQWAVVLLLQFLLLALLGLHVVRALLFPIAFLVFLVPFGRALVPYLVDFVRRCEWSIRCANEKHEFFVFLDDS